MLLSCELGVGRSSIKDKQGDSGEYQVKIFIEGFSFDVRKASRLRITNHKFKNEIFLQCK